MDEYGDHTLACPRTGLLAPTAPGVPADDGRWLDLVVCGATPRGGTLCCDATLVFHSREALTQMGPCSGQPSAASGPHTRSYAAEDRKSSLLWARRSGRWNGEAGRFVHDLLRVRSQRAPPTLRRGRRGRHTSCCRATERRQHGTGAGLARAAPPVQKG